MRTLLATVTLLFASATLAACVADPAADGSDDPTFADDSKADGATAGLRVCTTQHTGSDSDGDKVVFCDVAYDAQPRVKLPADAVHTGTTTSTLYAALNIAGMPAAIDRTGTQYTLVDATGRPISVSKLPSTLHLPSHRALYTIYKLTGIVTTYTDPNSSQSSPAFQISKAKPMIVIEGNAIDGAYLAPTYAFEGTVSRRSSATRFDPTNPVAVRITFTSLAPYPDMPAWATGTLKDGTRSQMIGAIENWSANVRGSDGTCLPSFASLGAANPWQGAAGPGVKLYRFPGMHFAADEVQVLDYPANTDGLGMNGMGAMSITHPAGLIQEQDGGSWNTISLLPHGTPNGHKMVLHPVIGGGGTCNWRLAARSPGRAHRVASTISAPPGLGDSVRRPAWTPLVLASGLSSALLLAMRSSRSTSGISCGAICASSCSVLGPPRSRCCWSGSAPRSSGHT